MKNLTSTAVRVLTILDAARLEGREWVSLNRGKGYKAYDAMLAAQLIAEGPGGVYRITEAGTKALVTGKVESNDHHHSNGVRPYTPPASNGHAGTAFSPSVTNGCTGDCPRARVLEIVAARYPSVRKLLEAVECFEEETRR